MEDEIHLCSDAGHILSVDCWCEPVDIDRCPRNDGTGDILVIRHVDNHDDPDDNDEIFYRTIIVDRRTKENDWITRALNLSPRLLGE